MPGTSDFEYVGDKFPRIYHKKYIGVLASLAGEDFASLTLIHVTRSPLEVINSICRRIENAKIGLDSWKAIESLEEAIAEWKKAWNARKQIYPKIPFDNVIDLNYNYLVNNPSESLKKIADLLGVVNAFDHSVISSELDGGLTSSSDQRFT